MSRLCDILSEILKCKKERALSELKELLNQIWPIKKLRDFGMKEEEIEEFANEVYDELQPVLATSYVPLSREELKRINQSLY